MADQSWYRPPFVKLDRGVWDVEFTSSDTLERVHVHCRDLAHAHRAANRIARRQHRENS